MIYEGREKASYCIVWRDLFRIISGSTLTLILLASTYIVARQIIAFTSTPWETGNLVSEITQNIFGGKIDSVINCFSLDKSRPLLDFPEEFRKCLNYDRGSRYG